MPGIEQLSVESIQNGDAIDRLNDALLKIATDAVSRYKITKPRTATLKITITPDADEDGKFITPVIEWDVGWAVPGHAGMKIRAFVQDGVVMVNRMELDARQRTLDEIDNVEQLKPKGAKPNAEGSH